MNKFAGFLAVLLTMSQTAATPALPEPITEYVYSGLDCNGRDFVVLHGEAYALKPDELTGEVLNDAYYAAATRFEEMHNVRLVDYKDAEPSQLMRMAVLAADDYYDVILDDLTELARLAPDGYFHDASAIDELTLDGIWWNRALNEQLKVGEGRRLYLLASDLALYNFNCFPCVIYDSSVYGDEPLELARDGKWTLDAMLELLRENEGGLSITKSVLNESLLLGCGVELLDEEKLTLRTGRRDLRSAAEKLCELVSFDVPTAPQKLALASAGMLRHEQSSPVYTSEGNLRVLPMPKLDSKRGYSSPIIDGYEALAIPITKRDTAEIGTLVNTLQYCASRDVVEVQYALASRTRSETLEEVEEMLDLIRASATLDRCALLSSVSLDALRLETALAEGTLTSLLAESSDVVAKSAEKVALAYAELEEMRPQRPARTARVLAAASFAGGRLACKPARAARVLAAARIAGRRLARKLARAARVLAAASFAGERLAARVSRIGENRGEATRTQARADGSRPRDGELHG